MSAPQTRSPAPRCRQRAINFRVISAPTLACLGPVLRSLAPGGKVIPGEPAE
jgi:hypothetical protein